MSTYKVVGIGWEIDARSSRSPLMKKPFNI